MKIGGRNGILCLDFVLLPRWWEKDLRQCMYNFCFGKKPFPAPLQKSDTFTKALPPFPKHPMSWWAQDAHSFRSCLDILIVLFMLFGKPKSIPYLNYCLFQTLKINIYHAEIWAAPHQAIRGLPEDWALLCSREPEAGGPRAYPFEQRLGDGRPCSWERQEKLGALQTPGRMRRGFILKPGSRT